MTLAKYETSWIGIDSGREGLWRDPIWKDVLAIIGQHVGEKVYDKSSPIYKSLEEAYPKEAWRSFTKEGAFRPLFRDYPNSWTRTGVVSLARQRFGITEEGQRILEGKISKTSLLTQMFKKHFEPAASGSTEENPFVILAAGITVAPRSLSTQEIYWSIMKNYRPGSDDLAKFIAKRLRYIRLDPEPTPYRRLRNMLSLMRAAGLVSSTRREGKVFWSPLNPEQLCKLTEV